MTHEGGTMLANSADLTSVNPLRQGRTTSVSTVQELITTYRLCEPHRRADDPRNARWWIEQVGPLPVTELTISRIHQALDVLRKDGRAENTITFYLRFIRRVCAWGVTLQYLSYDPCQNMPLPKEGEPPLRVLTPEEEQQLCEALGRPYNLWVRFAILTGLEQSEQFALQWRSVNLERGTMTVVQSGNRGIAEVTLLPEVLPILRALRQDYPTSTWVFPDPKNPMRPADPHNFYVSRWVRTIERIGIPHLAWKDLRHTCGVRLAQQGVPVSEITAFMRQREVRQAYKYRAWRPGEQMISKRPRPVLQEVFRDLTDDELQTLMARDITSEPFTFGEMCRLYAVHQLKARPSRRKFDSMYRQYLQRWGDRPMGEITRREVRLWHMGKSEIPWHANGTINAMRTVYQWASSLDLYTGLNPAQWRGRYVCQPRDIFLQSDQLQRFLHGLEQVSPVHRAYLWTLLFTAARGIEVRAMRWADIDWETRLWRKPKTKNGTPHYLEIPRQVVEVLNDLPRRSEWVFSDKTGKPWARCTPEKVWLFWRRRWNLEGIRLHDIRRTAASLLSIEGENIQTVQHVLNHKSLTQTSVYARLNTKPVGRALQAQADRICQRYGPAPIALSYSGDQASDDERTDDKTSFHPPATRDVTMPLIQATPRPVVVPEWPG